nr:YibE/F family protein [uncultured Trichococcus sp.]
MKKGVLVRSKRILLTFFAVLLGMLTLFSYNNYAWYEEPIAKITAAEAVGTDATIGAGQENYPVYYQQLTAVLMNGESVGELIVLENSYSDSLAYSQMYREDDEVFLSLSEGDTGAMTGKIVGVKRDKYVVLFGSLFLFALVATAGKKGLLSLVSIAGNILLFGVALYSYEIADNAQLLWISSAAVIGWTVLTLLLVSGRNRKTYAAILATLIGTFMTLIIAYGVIFLTNGQGLRYEEMQFVTHYPRRIFLSSILIGSLGAVMDVAITMTAAIQELYEKDPAISAGALLQSGREIGKDIMGTMANVLLFAYVSGAIPTLVFYLENGSDVFYTFSMQLSLEITRALAGSLGIVLTVPLAMFIAVRLIPKKVGDRR